MTFSESIKNILNETGLSMRELSELTDIPYRTIQDWKAGKREPSAAMRFMFADKVNRIKNDNLYIADTDDIHRPGYLFHADSVQSAAAQLCTLLTEQGNEILETLEAGQKTSYPSASILVVHKFYDGPEPEIAVVYSAR